MSLIIFEAMKDAIKRGQRNWNWGGTWLSQKASMTLKKWGIDYPYHYFIKVYDNDLKNFQKIFSMKIIMVFIHPMRNLDS